MLLEDVHPHHGFVELWIQRLDDLIVQMLLQKEDRTSDESQFPPTGRRSGVVST